MGNQECSVRHAAQECSKTTGMPDWAPGQGRVAYGHADGQTASASSTRNAGEPHPEVVGSSLDDNDLGPPGLSVEQVGRKDKGLVHAHSVITAQDRKHTKDTQGTRMDAHDLDEIDVSKVLHKTYFDCEIGEAPAHHDASESERCRADHTFQTGATYSGEWLHGLRDGIGRQQWTDGTVYVGEWAQGRANGKGQLVHIDGDTYIGFWADGRAHGLGVYEFHHGAAIYCGEFRLDLREGLGQERWQEGSVYRGEFKKAMKSGYGINTWPNDSASYSGHWSNNELQGPGVFEADGRIVYQGEWEKSAPNGMGSYDFADGSWYKGAYKMDRKHGFGVFKEASHDGAPVQGFWTDGLLVKSLPAGKE